MIPMSKQLSCLTRTLSGIALALTLSAPAIAAMPDGDITISAPGRPAVTLTPTQIQTLPAVDADIAFATAHGPFHAHATGPLLWTVLLAVHAINPKSPETLAHEAVTTLGADHYAATLALGELAPAFADKKIILATAVNGKPLAPGHYRLFVPGDGHGGRSVRDVAGFTVTNLHP
jgi:hypothetical protein